MTRPISIACWPVGSGRPRGTLRNVFSRSLLPLVTPKTRSRSHDRVGAIAPRDDNSKVRQCPGSVGNNQRGRNPFSVVSRRRQRGCCSTGCREHFSETGECLLLLGRLDEAAAAFLESVNRLRQMGDMRSVAVYQRQIGRVPIRQGRYPEALELLSKNRDIFATLGEPRRGGFGVVRDRHGE